jgi:insulysin
MDIAIAHEEIQTHMRELLSQVNLRILVTGNMYKDVSELIIDIGRWSFTGMSLQEAIKLAEIAEEGLGICSRSSVDLNDYALILPEGICLSSV